MLLEEVNKQQIELTTHNDERFIVSNVVIENNNFTNAGGVLIGVEHGHENISIKNNIFNILRCFFNVINAKLSFF